MFGFGSVRFAEHDQFKTKLSLISNKKSIYLGAQEVYKKGETGVFKVYKPLKVGFYKNTTENLRNYQESSVLFCSIWLR